MIDVFWLEQSTRDVPQGLGWLAPSEQSRLGTLRFAKRRADWILGRWTAKAGLRAYFGQGGPQPAWERIEIGTAGDGAPEVLLPAERVCLSLSHSASTALCVIGPYGIALGCDIEAVERRATEFVEDYFTEGEKERVRRSPAELQPLLVTLIWCAKESALKALRQGLRRDTRDVEVDPVFAPAAPIASGGWRALAARCADPETPFYGWWREDGSLVRTVLSPLRISEPFPLEPAVVPGR